MTGIEKKMLIALAACLALFVGSLIWLERSITEAGGVKGIAVEIGKDIKDVAREIEKH